MGFGGGGQHPVYQEIQYIAPEILFLKKGERKDKTDKKKIQGKNGDSNMAFAASSWTPDGLLLPSFTPAFKIKNRRKITWAYTLYSI